MKKQIICIFILYFFVFYVDGNAQKIEKSTSSVKVSGLFMNQDLLHLKLSFSNKNIKKNTNDSTYIKSDLIYLTAEEVWDTIEVGLRTRGNFRLKNCYFPPVKIKIKKSVSKGTLFKGNKKLKLVLPCLKNNDKNDYIIKEYMAYKLFETNSPYHFKTRLVDISFTEIKGKKTKVHDLKGILIEDDKKVAKRFDGKVVDRNIHPLGQETVASVRNAFFQYMIGNLDYSTMVQHNEKLLYINNKFTPIPYDFDMSGLINPSYGVVAVINNEELVSSLTERLYRGFERHPKIIEKVRKEYIKKKDESIEIVDNLAPYFDDPKQFSKAKTFILDFFNIIQDDIKFEKNIIAKLRSK